MWGYNKGTQGATYLIKRCKNRFHPPDSLKGLGSFGWGIQNVWIQDFEEEFNDENQAAEEGE